MLTAMTLIFLAGYLAIALEHPLKMNKAGTALLTGTILWVIYTFAAPECIPTVSADALNFFLQPDRNWQSCHLSNNAIIL